MYSVEKQKKETFEKCNWLSSVFICTMFILYNLGYITVCNNPTDISMQSYIEGFWERIWMGSMSSPS